MVSEPEYGGIGNQGDAVMRKMMLFGAAMVLAIACTGCGSDPNFGKTPEQIEEWIRSDNSQMAEMAWDSGLLDSYAELSYKSYKLTELTIDYAEPIKGKVKFTFEANGLNAKGIADKKTHAIEQMMFQCDLSNLMEDLGLYESARNSGNTEQLATLLLGAISEDVENREIILKYMFELTDDETDALSKATVAEGVNQTKQVYNGTEYTVGYDKGSDCYYITSFGSYEELNSYMNNY